MAQTAPLARSKQPVRHSQHSDLQNGGLRHLVRRLVWGASIVVASSLGTETGFAQQVTPQPTVRTTARQTANPPAMRRVTSQAARHAANTAQPQQRNDASRSRASGSVNRSANDRWQERTHLRNSSRSLKWSRPRTADFDQLHRKSPTFLNGTSEPVPETVQPQPIPQSAPERQVHGVTYIELSEGLPRIVPEPESVQTSPQPFPLERQRNATPIHVIERVPEFVPAEPTSIMAAYQDEAGDVFGDADLDALVPGDGDDLPSLDETLPEPTTADESLPNFDESELAPETGGGIFDDLEPLDPPPSDSDPSPMPPDEVLEDNLGTPDAEAFPDDSGDLNMLDPLDSGEAGSETRVPANSDDDFDALLEDDLNAGDLPSSDLPSDLPEDSMPTDPTPSDTTERLPDDFPDLEEPGRDLPSNDSTFDDLPDANLPGSDLPGTDTSGDSDRPTTSPPLISPSDRQPGLESEGREPSRGSDAFEADEHSTTSDNVIISHNGRDCPAETAGLQQAWEELRSRPLRSIDLDITPAIDLHGDKQADQEAREENLSQAPARTWRNLRGQKIAFGKLADFRNGRVIVDDGTQKRALSWYDLSNADLCFVTAWWELPTEFSPNVREYQVRNWTMTSFTWKASGLCHQPLYFEEVALERYGHSAGPIKQVALSGAHFFGSILFLPYNMGVTPPTECKYSLGYYRPGSCAPWLVPAVPLSARGARWQLGAVVGGLTLLP